MLGPDEGDCRNLEITSDRLDTIGHGYVLTKDLPMSAVYSHAGVDSHIEVNSLAGVDAPVGVDSRVGVDHGANAKMNGKAVVVVTSSVAAVLWEEPAMDHASPKKSAGAGSVIGPVPDVNVSDTVTGLLVAEVTVSGDPRWTLPADMVSDTEQLPL